MIRQIKIKLTKTSEGMLTMFRQIKTKLTKTSEGLLTMFGQMKNKLTYETIVPIYVDILQKIGYVLNKVGIVLTEFFRLYLLNHIGGRSRDIILRLLRPREYAVYEEPIMFYVHITILIKYAVVAIYLTQGYIPAVSCFYDWFSSLPFIESITSQFDNYFNIDNSSIDKNELVKNLKIDVKEIDADLLEKNSSSEEVKSDKKTFLRTDIAIILVGFFVWGTVNSFSK
jgi:hypothetical protein